MSIDRAVREAVAQTSAMTARDNTYKILKILERIENKLDILLKEREK